MKKLLLFACLWAGVGIYAQEIEVDQEFGNQLAHPFLQLEREKVPGGVLLDYSLGLTDLKLYDGTLKENSDIDITVYSNIYKEVFMGIVNPQGEQNMRPLRQLVDQWAVYRTQTNDKESEQTTLVLSGILSNYAYIDEVAADNRDIIVEGNQFFDVYRNGVWQNPYKTGKAVAIAAPINNLSTGNFNVLLPEDLFIGNAKSEIVNIQMQIDNSERWQAINFNEPIPVEITTEGTHNLLFKIQLQSGQVLNTRLPVNLKFPHIPIDFATNVKINNDKYSATLRIDYIDDRVRKITRPLIVAEGFDLSSVTNPEKKGGDLSLADFKNRLTGRLSNVLDNDDQQYDIVYVDWHNGVGDIRENAETLKKIIKYVNDKKAENGSTEPNVLLGQSMGGLVSKYALRKLEQEGYNHQVKLFVTHDSPLRGAIIPAGAQFMVRHVNTVYVSNPFLQSMGDVVLPALDDIVSMFGGSFLNQFGYGGSNYLTIIDCPAAVQMSKNYLDPNWQFNDGFHQSWQTEFDGLGYPSQNGIRNVAISNGNMCAIDQGFNAGDNLFLYNKQTSSVNEVNNTLINFSMTFWGATTNNIGLVLYSLIPLSSQLRADFQIKTIPAQNAGNREVYRGILKFDKRLKIGKFINIGFTKTVMEKIGTAPNSLLPIENESGGGYNISNLDTPIDDYIVQDQFSFIPVASALDIRRSGGEPNLSDFRRPYANKNNLGVTSLTTPFHDFVAETTADGIDNFEHIHFTSKSGNYLGQELLELLNNTTNYTNTNCEAFCNLEEIYGEDKICKNTEYYFSIPEIAEGTVSWSVSADLEIIPDNDESDSTIKVRLKNDYLNGGANTITVVINAGDCGRKTLSKTVYVGMEAPDGIYGSNQFYVSNNPNLNLPQGERTYSVDPVPGATYYEWDVTGGFIEVNNFSAQPTQWEILASTKNTNEIEVKASGPATIRVRACNDCGCSNYISLQVKTVNLDDYFVQYPNPADDHIVLALKEGVTPPAFEGNRTDVFIYDMQGRMKKQFIISPTGGETNVSELSTGIYKMQIDLQNGNFQVVTLQISR